MTHCLLLVLNEREGQALLNGMALLLCFENVVLWVMSSRRKAEAEDSFVCLCVSASDTPAAVENEPQNDFQKGGGI